MTEKKTKIEKKRKPHQFTIKRTVHVRWLKELFLSYKEYNTGA